MRNVSLLLPPLAAGALALPAAATEPTVNELIAQGKFCTATAAAVARACSNESLDDYWLGLGICINESDGRDRNECFTDLKDSLDEAKDECAAQRQARLDLCKKLGEDRYDPEFEARDFDRDFRNLTNPNPYFPLTIGNRWVYRSATEKNVVQVTGATKLIDDVRCIVVRDEVFEDGFLTEGTNDWFAQAKDGTVWYCGEETAEFETFDGDRPVKPELVSIEGSFKADRDGDKPGIIFLANPRPSQTYIEESSLGNAEDATTVIVVDYSYGRYPNLDRLVPPGLARLLCARNCVVTRNTSSLEPGSVERKYYAPGIGVFLETAPQTGEVNRLVNCNFDPRCSQLPQ
ncbi:MAG TPA: hypothetical protein VJ299_17125 [Steroidobacteraceae bacterium]|jgi:hypothetical protein|nr:hypothetical protein [Steroidobacteraceae bacterium]